MHDDHPATADPGSLLSCFTAELAEAAYAVLLRAGVCGAWIDVKLDVWRGLAESVKHRQEQISSATRLVDEREPWRDAVLAELTDVAYRAGLQHGLQASFLQVVLELHHALRRVIERLPARHAVAARLWRLHPAWHV